MPRFQPAYPLLTGHVPGHRIRGLWHTDGFHAYCEVYLGQEWLTFDPRFNVPRIGRVKVAHGADAVDGAFATIYGEANLTDFAVWAYQVNPREVSVGDLVRVRTYRIQIPGDELSI